MIRGDIIAGEEEIISCNKCHIALIDGMDVDLSNDPKTPCPWCHSRNLIWGWDDVTYAMVDGCRYKVAHKRYLKDVKCYILTPQREQADNGDWGSS
jgi:hypothetical protein